jgi:hypothetical protein
MRRQHRRVLVKDEAILEEQMTHLRKTYPKTFPKQLKPSAYKSTYNATSSHGINWTISKQVIGVILIVAT